MQQKAILLAHPYLQLVSGSVRRNQFDFDSNTLSINMTTGAVNGVSVIPISPLWSTFGNSWAFGQG